MTTLYRHLLLALGFVLATCSTASASNRIIGEFKLASLAPASSIDTPAEANTNIIAAVQTAILLSTGVVIHCGLTKQGKLSPYGWDVLTVLKQISLEDKLQPIDCVSFYRAISKFN